MSLIKESKHRLMSLATFFLLLFSQFRKCWEQVHVCISIRTRARSVRCSWAKCSCLKPDLMTWQLVSSKIVFDGYDYDCSLIIFSFWTFTTLSVSLLTPISIFFLICLCVSGVDSDLSNQPNLLLGQFWGCQSSYLWVIKIACPLSFSLPGPNERTAVQLVTPKLQFCGSYGNRTGSTGLYQYQLPTKSRRWNEKQLNSVHGYSPVQLVCAASSIIDLVLISYRRVSLSSSAVKGKRCTRKAQ